MIFQRFLKTAAAPDWETDCFEIQATKKIHTFYILNCLNKSGCDSSHAENIEIYNTYHHSV